jgi:hypothetical protein
MDKYESIIFSSRTPIIAPLTRVSAFSKAFALRGSKLSFRLAFIAPKHLIVVSQEIVMVCHLLKFTPSNGCDLKDATKPTGKNCL